MDKAVLVGVDIEGGKQLLNAMDAAGMDVRAAFWYYEEEPERWRLYVATPLVDSDGPRAVYGCVRSLLDQLPSVSLSLADMKVISPRDGKVTILRTAYQTGPRIADLSVKSSTINGVYTAGIYLYRMNE